MAGVVETGAALGHAYLQLTGSLPTAHLEHEHGRPSSVKQAMLPARVAHGPLRPVRQWWAAQVARLNQQVKKTVLRARARHNTKVSDALACSCCQGLGTLPRLLKPLHYHRSHAGWRACHLCCTSWGRQP